jgi:hypothetical protein
MLFLIFIIYFVLEIPCRGQSIHIASQFQRHDFRTVIDNRIVRPWAKDFIGINTFNINYQTKLSSNLDIGLGYGYEISTTPAQLRSTLISEFNDIKNGIPINRYFKHLIFNKVEFILPISKKIHLGSQSLMSFGFHRAFNNTKIIPKQANININEIFYNDVEISPFIRIIFSRINFDFGLRVIHFKRVDDAIFYKEFYDKWDTVIDSKIYNKLIDMYNPLKLNFSLGYTFKTK